MVRKITEQDFLAKVKVCKCKGNLVKGGGAEEGHSKCNDWCQGNYFVGGECNYGGHHTIESDLRILNRNFADFDALLENQEEIYKAVSEQDFNKIRSKLISDFGYLKRKCEDDKLEHFKGTCFQIDGEQKTFLKLIKEYLRTLANTLERYVNKAERLNYWQLKDYREKRDKLDEMQKEANQLMSDCKEAIARGDEVEANRLMGLFNQKKKAMGELMKELKKNPVDGILGEEAKEFFADIVKNIFGGNTSFFNEPDNPVNQKEEKVWGFIPLKYWGKVKWGGITIVVLLVIFFVYRWFKRKVA